LFTGEQRDWETGLYYLRARYYDPEIGRFLAQDPLRGSQLHPQTQNRYPYVGNNPTNWLDPTGLRILYRGEFYRGAGKEGSNFVAASNRNPNCNGTLEFTTGLQGALG
ncbi:MAG: hypothetical protein GTO63_23685, partial [Anaerolineae bacterium]|nr:hypothetical protein [Anaerolineae bacterium]NIN97728.1 hypothetical protein [Anaerolineae bacterium]NIQ80709.1 hypothetical protein [Anaerolineae bacterium]